ncbi:uncharacterized protein LOC127258493 [Andrographis paniculata]|uniref:uncharacterized protein LOC127258493 n=1 Tax=Andrographis paniculata TaxID=175694 RepID=UPI0021E844F8|nr:uncharacterized protein LOC127258493 [Andrographis paniculata]
MRALLREDNKALREKYFVESFIGGLREKIGKFVTMQKPNTLRNAIQLAIQSEDIVNLLTKGHRGLKRGSSHQPTVPVTKIGSDVAKPKLPPIRRVYLIIGEDDGESETDIGTLELGECQGVEEPQISLNVVAGQVPSNTIKLLGKSNNYELVILLDSGSTHTFLDPKTASKLRCTMEFTNPWLITIADGNKVECRSKCHMFAWEMGGHRFSAPVRLLKLGGCDMGAGNGRHCGFLMHYCDTEIVTLLQEYQHLFELPVGLPPKRSMDHRIPTKPNIGPIKQHAYRYPMLQMREIEKLVDEMLQTGVIRPSNSPYSSPVLLVKKKDGSWRFCIDYRKLNATTIKDSYPIPLVDDLLDKLGEATIFAKIDLRAGYHQIRMHEEDIPKTVFVTASGLYEFVVMPFGLTNAPTTFQAVMNQIFKSHLRDFILCSFGRREVEYLGHIIGSGRVRMDKSKVQAMLDWPTPSNVKALRGFLGLTGYYRKFIQHYGTIAKALTDLTKKGRFVWSPEAELPSKFLKIQ